MTFLTPIYAIVAASIAVPTLLILYFLKLKRRRQQISSTLLWKRAVQDLQANAPFQKLRKNLLLFLQLLILAGAILALGQPQINTVGTVGQRHVILIDRSASMSATDASPSPGSSVSRLQAAKDQALTLIDSLRDPGLIERDAGDQAMIIAFDKDAVVVQGFTSDKARLRDAVASIQPSDCTSLLEPAVRLARAQAPKLVLTETVEIEGKQSTESRTIEGASDRWPINLHIFSDGRLPDALQAKPGPADAVFYHRLGQPTSGNLGLVALRAERSLADPQRITVFYSVQSTHAATSSTTVQIFIDGSARDQKPISLPAAGDRPAVQSGVFEWNQREGALAEVRLINLKPESDALATDNKGYLAIPPAKALKIALVTKGNMFLPDALASLPQADNPVTITPEKFADGLKSGDSLAYDCVVLDGWLPKWGDTPADSLPPGRFLVFNAVPNAIAAPRDSPDAEPVALGPVLVDRGAGGPASILRWVKDHRVLRNVDLDTLDIFESRVVEVPKGSSAQVLAESTTGPAILELSMPQARAIVVPFDLTASDWPYDVSFIAFLSYAVDYLGAGGGVGSDRTVATGSTITDHLPPGAADLKASGEGGLQIDSGISADGAAAFGPLRLAGPYSLSWTGRAAEGDEVHGTRATRRYAANLLDAAESDIAAAEQIKLATVEASANSGDRATLVRNLWPYLLLAALAVIMLEWYIYNRKVYL